MAMVGRCWNLCGSPWHAVKDLSTPQQAPASPDRFELRARAATPVHVQEPQVQALLRRAVKVAPHGGRRHGHMIRRVVDEKGQHLLMHNDPIAQGAYGRAYVCVDERHPERVFVLKKLRLDADKPSKDLFCEPLPDVAHETFMALQAHSQVAPQEVLVTGKTSHQKAYIKMPALRGNLHDLLATSLSTRQRSLLARAVFTHGLRQLAEAHAQGVVHRDVKPSNFLYNDHAVVLCDWGLATPSTDWDELHTGAGTPPYMAPENFTNRRAACGALMDVWSLGITTMRVLKGSNPWQHVCNLAAADPLHRTSAAALHAATRALHACHDAYKAWRAQDDAQGRAERARFDAWFDDIDAPLRRVLLMALTPDTTQRPDAQLLLGMLQSISGGALNDAEQAELNGLLQQPGALSDAIDARVSTLRQTLHLPMVAKCDIPAPARA